MKSNWFASHIRDRRVYRTFTRCCQMEMLIGGLTARKECLSSTSILTRSTGSVKSSLNPIAVLVIDLAGSNHVGEDQLRNNVIEILAP